jgi:putative MATE family efflux protein
MKSKNALTTKPIPGLIKQIAIPASIGFFFNTMYNVVDTFYSGLVSSTAIAALSISFPVFFIILAIGSGISTGATALISNFLGEENKTKARLYFHQALSFGVIMGILLMILSFVISPFLFKILGAKGEYLEIAVEYIYNINYGIVFFLLNFILNSRLNAMGDTKTFRNIFIVSFFLNLIFDPWFLYGGFGLPKMGLAGISLATTFIQFLVFVYLIFTLLKRKLLKIKSFKNFIPQKKIFYEIAKQGFPASLNMMTIAIGIFVITYFLSDFGEDTVAAYGVATRIDQLALLPMAGLTNATLTLVGQNNGAKKFKRVRKTIKLSLIYASLIVIICTILVFLFPRFIMDLFTDNQNVINIGAFYLKISAFIYHAYVILYVLVAALQGAKKPFYAIFIGIFRQIIGAAFIFYFLVKILNFGLNGVWYGIFFTTWSSAIITIFYARYVFRRMR